MEGLEITVLKKSELPNDNPKLRLDAQFQDRAILKTVRKIRERDFVTIGNLTGKSLRGKNVAYTEDGISPIVRSGDINQFFDSTNLLRSDETDEIFYLKNGDVLISSIGFGSIGKVQLYEHDERCGVVSEVTVIRQNQFEPAFVAAFLCSKFGQYQIERFITGATGQLHLYPSDVDRIVLPDCSKAFQTHIAELYKASQQAHLEAKGLLELADQQILAALGLADWQPPEPLSYVASSKDAFASGRLDAQYFRPMYDEVEERLEATGQSTLLSDILSINQRGRQPQYSDDGLPVVNSKHVRTNRVLLTDNRTATEDGSPITINKGDVLLNGTGVGTIGRAAAYLHDQRALPDNHVTVLRTDKIDPIYLSVFLNSPLGQLQIERHIKGSSGQIELYPKDIEKIQIWDAPTDLQETVRDAVLSAFAEEHRSRSLLEQAMHAVEIAIEENEDAALSFLDDLARKEGE